MTLMPIKIYLPVTLLPIALAISLAGCEPTRPPLTQLDQAGRLLQTARTSGAPTYAPLELRYADERLMQARAKADKHDYDEALQLADESSANSDLAITKSRLGKMREKVDARTRENAQLQQELVSGAEIKQGSPEQ
jgi:Domain of unknown function (DUF4398)